MERLRDFFGDIHPFESDKQRTRRILREAKKEKRANERDMQPFIAAEEAAFREMANLKAKCGAGDTASISRVQQLAFDVVTARRNKQAFQQIGASIDSQTTSIRSAAATKAMVKRMEKTTKIVKRLNNSSAMAKLPNTAVQFQIQTSMAEEKQAMALETIKDTTTKENDEEDAAEIFDQVLTQAGMQYISQI